MKTMSKIIFWLALAMSILIVGMGFSCAYEIRGYFAVGGELFFILLPIMLVWGKFERMTKNIRCKNRIIARLKEENKFLREERKEVK